MISVEFRGSDEPLNKLRALAKGLNQLPSVVKGVKEATWILHSRIIANISGPILKRKTGRLATSFRPPEVVVTQNEIKGLITSDVVYARIHETGGVIRAHTIVPRHGKALRFKIGSQTFIRKKVFVPAFRMPERRYIKRSIAQTKETMLYRISQGIQEALDTGR